MKKLFFSLFLVTVVLLSCKKNGSSDTGGAGTNATVTFTNDDLFAKRVILTGTGSTDTIFPLPNKVLDIDVQAKSSVTRTDVPTGKRKLVVVTNCTAHQPVNASCTGYVYRNAEYLANKTYAELLK